MQKLATIKKILFFRGKERRSVVGYNVAEGKISRHQKSNTAMVARGRMSGMAIKSREDEKKIGRRCWMKISTQERLMYATTLYMPCYGVNKNSAGMRSRDKYKRMLDAS